jgi:hypothetical protein
MASTARKSPAHALPPPSPPASPHAVLQLAKDLNGLLDRVVPKPANGTPK